MYISYARVPSPLAEEGQGEGAFHHTHYTPILTFPHKGGRNQASLLCLLD